MSSLLLIALAILWCGSLPAVAMSDYCGQLPDGVTVWSASYGGRVGGTWGRVNHAMADAQSGYDARQRCGHAVSRNASYF